MNKKKELEAKLGAHCLENTLQVIHNMPDNDTMVFGTEELSKQQILERFELDGDFALMVAEQLDKSVKAFLVRRKYGRRKTPRKSG